MRMFSFSTCSIFYPGCIYFLTTSHLTGYTLQKLANKKALFVVVMLYISCACEQKSRIREVLLWGRKRAKGLTGSWLCTSVGCSGLGLLFIFFFDSEGREFPVREEDTFVPHSFLLLMYVWTQYLEEEQKACWAMLSLSAFRHCHPRGRRLA